MKRDYYYSHCYVQVKVEDPKVYAVIRVPENVILATFNSFSDAQDWLNLVKPAGSCRIFEQVQ